MKTTVFFLILICSCYTMKAQGYLGKRNYLSVEALHPATAIPDLKISYGILFHRFYALDFQARLFYARKDLYTWYTVRFINFKNGHNEYKAGQANIYGTGFRFSFRNFGKASYKAAPVGWYISYAAELMPLFVKSSITLESSDGSFSKEGNFNSHSNQDVFSARATIVSALITGGKCIRLNTSIFIDMGIEMGARYYFLNEEKWSRVENPLYFIESPFMNRINSWYMYKDRRVNSVNGKAELIYEPFIKIGYVF
jgi:hypothetical protein